MLNETKHIVMKRNINTIANLLATENLLVVEDNVQTASFDVEKRILTLPRLDVSDEVNNLFVAHEVAHALWTSLEDVKNTDFKSDAFHSYVNIVEDARIEKLIKKRYPGVRRDFIKGYTELFESNFFKVEEDEIPLLPLIDRLNIEFKLRGNYLINIPFSDDEMVFVKRMESLETWDDVIQLATDLYNHQKEQNQSTDPEDSENSENQENGQSESSNDYQETDGDSTDVSETFGSSNPSNESEQTFESDEQPTSSSDDQQETVEDTEDNGSDADVTSTGPGEGHELDSVDQPLTDVDFGDLKKERIYDYGKPNKYVPISDFEEYKKHIIKNETIYNEILNCNSFGYFDYHEHSKKQLKELKKDLQPMVNYLGKQFDMKKAAFRHKNTHQHTTGVLNMNKIHEYRYNDNIFLSNEVIADAKNHGFVAFIDWSGSMSRILAPTIKQLQLTALFCRKVGIPFAAYAFTDRSNVSTKISDEYTNRVGLIELFTPNSRNKDFERQLFVTEFLKYTKTSLTQLGGTPLNITVLLSHKIIEDFMKANRVQKMITLYLTDGHDGQAILEDQTYNSIGIRHGGRGYYTHDTNQMYQLIRDVTPSKVLVFNITPHPPRGIDKRNFSKKGFHILNDNGYDACYYMNHRKLYNSQFDNNSQNKLDQLDEDASYTKIKSAFSKTRSNRLENKDMLNHFVSMVA